MLPPGGSTRDLKSSLTVSSMSDHELRAALKEHGVNAGPITDSTRGLYRKKLESLIGTKKATETIKEESDQDLDLEEESSDESFLVDEEELNASSDSYSEEVEEQDDDDDTDLESSNREEVNETNQPSRFKFYTVLLFSLLAIAASVYMYSNNKLGVYKNLTRQLLILLALSPIGYFIYKTYKFYMTRRNEENKRVCELVSEALELLQSPENPKGLMPILHIRDTLLTPAERKAKKTIMLWQKAVKFVEDHESRVKVELVNIDGEDFRAWKWIGSRKLL